MLVLFIHNQRVFQLELGMNYNTVNKRVSLLWSVSNEPAHFWHEIGKHGQSSHHVEHYEHFATVSLWINITVTHLQNKNIFKWNLDNRLVW